MATTPTSLRAFAAAASPFLQGSDDFAVSLAASGAFRGRASFLDAAAAAVSPPFNAAFFSYTAALTHAVDEGVREGWGSAAGRARMADKVARKVDDKLWPTVARSLTLWVPFNTVMFLYIPLALRPLAGSCVGLGWNIYLSIIAAAAPPVPSAHAPAHAALPL